MFRQLARTSSALIIALGFSTPAIAQVTEPTRQAPMTMSAPAFSGSPFDQLRFGAGGSFGGSSLGVGGSVRNWFGGKVGIGAEISRIGVYGISITQIAPIVLYRIGEDRLGDAVTFRPYAGGGLNFYRVGYSDLFGAASDTSTGVQFFVGAEMVFDGAPKLGVSFDIGYHATGELLDGLSIGGIAFRGVAHYYFK